MAGTITSQLTNITLAESGDSANWDDISGGPGSSQDDGSPVQGTEVRARRIDNVTARGFGYDSTTAVDLSGTNTHLTFWALVLQPALISSYIEFSLSDSGTNCQSGNWDGHQFAQAGYPFQGGWVRVFIDVSRTRDAGSGTLNLSTGPRNFGARFPMGDVGGTTPNCQLDRIDYTTGGLLIDGGTVPSPAVFADFSTADQGNTSNRYGVVVQQGGIDFVNARITIADATATIFNDTPNVVFADQPLASSDFQGLTVDLQNASTTVDFSGGSVASAPTGTNEGDFVVTSTSGSFDSAGTSYTKLRLLTLTSACALLNSVFTTCGQIEAVGANLSGSNVIESSAATAVLWNVATDTDGLLDAMSFTSDGTGHAIELGSSTPTTIDLNNQTYTGYAGTDGSTGNEVLYNNSGKTITVNVAGATGTLSVRNGASATTILVVDPVTLTITTINGEDATPIQSTRVIIYAGTTTGDLNADAAITSITRSGSTATVTTTAAHGLATSDVVFITDSDTTGALDAEAPYTQSHEITVTGASTFTYTVTGTPTTPATRTYVFSDVIIDAELTNASGVVSDIRSYSSDQAIRGSAKKGGGTPFVAQAIVGTVSSTAGVSITVSMPPD